MSARDPFIHSYQQAKTWLEVVKSELQTDQDPKAYAALRAVLHSLRDRLTHDEAAHLAAQLPTQIRGVFYEGWRPSETPLRIRTLEGFIDLVARRLEPRTDLDAQEAMRAVFNMLASCVSQGEIADVRGSMPMELQEFWQPAG